MPPTENNKSNVDAMQVFSQLLEKAHVKFGRLRDTPAHHVGDQSRSYQHAFRAWNEVWMYQQNHRTELVEAGLKRSEIGEIASRIGQLYYNHYLKTADTKFLSESYTFYSAIHTRGYFAEAHQCSPALAVKELRYMARFILTCLLLGRKEEACSLLQEFQALINAYIMTCQPLDASDWQLVVSEITSFLNADVAMPQARSPGTAISFKPQLRCPSAGPEASVAPHTRRVKEAVLVCYQHRQVKIAEMPLDLFRMMQALEWQDARLASVGEGGSSDGTAGSLGDLKDSAALAAAKAAAPAAASGSGSGAAAASSSKASARHDNPHKTLLYRTTAPTLMSVLHGTCASLPSCSSSAGGASGSGTSGGSSGRDMLLLYIGAHSFKSRESAAAAAANEARVKEAAAAAAGPAAAGGAAAGPVAAPPPTPSQEAPGPAPWAGASAADTAQGAAGAALPAPGGAVAAVVAALEPLKLDSSSSSQGQAAEGAAGSAAGAAGDAAGEDHQRPSVLVSSRSALVAALAQQQQQVQAQTQAQTRNLARGLCLSPPKHSQACECLLFPEDLLPLTRRRLFLVVDSDVAHDMAKLQGHELCYPLLALLSPVHRPSAFQDMGRTGSLFPLFLSSPLMAFCLIMGESDPGAQALTALQAAVDESAREIGQALAAELMHQQQDRSASACASSSAGSASSSGSISPWSDAFQDVLLRQLMTRFVLARAALAYHQASFGRPECQPQCFPPLPDQVSPSSKICAEAVVRITSVVQRQGLFKRGISHFLAQRTPVA